MRPGLLRAAACGYRQGQSPAPGTREYFYYIDHRGQLFLDDAKVKNFITCFKDQRFLTFFFERLRPNRSGRYEAAFPYLSPCGRERNYVRCEDRTTTTGSTAAPQLLSYCGGGERLAVPFEPRRFGGWAAGLRFPKKIWGVPSVFWGVFLTFGVSRPNLGCPLTGLGCFPYVWGVPNKFGVPPPPGLGCLYQVWGFNPQISGGPHQIGVSIAGLGCPPPKNLTCHPPGLRGPPPKLGYP
uniref:Chromosome 8 open reading frame 82 n=1 Tax=Anas zonorhyncha TaxID=75864 RepID=A0A8B9VA80_9AVES